MLLKKGAIFMLIYFHKGLHFWVVMLYFKVLLTDIIYKKY